MARINWKAPDQKLNRVEEILGSYSDQPGASDINNLKL
jgi:hypothetical protein